MKGVVVINLDAWGATVSVRRVAPYRHGGARCAGLSLREPKMVTRLVY